MSVEKPYSQTVGSGQYTKKSGISGKYDNIRRFWEDEVTRYFLRPFLKDLLDKKERYLERLKILDLGCGAGDGYELLMGIKKPEAGLYENNERLIRNDILGLYLGVDINSDLIEQARADHGENEKIEFRTGDFFKVLSKEEGPFDVYFTSYGTFSHNTDDTSVRLLCEIAQHCNNYAVIICDWLGRYSYEWQDLWKYPVNGQDKYPEEFIDYKISYVYPPSERNRSDIQSFPLRILSKDELENIVKRAVKESGIDIKISQIFDRSIFVGRHMDTGQYNKNCPCLRDRVNSLLEPNERTNLQSLIIDYVPKRGFTELNVFFEGFAMCWNSLVKHTMDFLYKYEIGRELGENIDYSGYPDALKYGLLTMKEVLEVAGKLPGDGRANIIEPQLAYMLRNLEIQMQLGYGVGHGFGAILEINK